MQEDSEKSPTMFLRAYWREYKYLFICSVLCVVMEAVCDLLGPQIMSRLIDNGVGRLDMQYVLMAGLGMLGVTAAGTVFACTRNVISSRVSQNVGAKMRHDLFVKIGCLSVSDAERFDGGALVTRMTNDVTQLTNFVNGIMRIFVKAPITCIGSIVLASMINYRTMPIVIIIVVAAFAVILLSMKLSYPVYGKVQQAIDKVNRTVREYLIGIRLVKAFGRSRYEKERFSRANHNLSDISKKANRINAVFTPLASLFVNLGIAAIILIGARLVGSGDMKVGQIMAFVTYMSQILFSLIMVTNVLNIFVRTKASYVRIMDIMKLPNQENFAETSVEKKGDMGKGMTALRFENVTFSYPFATGETTLRSIDFTLEKGQTLGIIGPTGSGKSTLASLLLRFYEANEGVVYVGGKEITNIPPDVLRRHIAVVPQSPMLFTGTIRENICFGKEGAADEDVKKAAGAAEAAEFIEASVSGYDTPLGQNGINLSGGQKQRLSIARAIVGQPDILILDDCTSALDTLTEARVQKNLRKYAENLTCIIISQRIRSIMEADCILVLDDGNQAGFGTHDELMNTNEIYREIYQLQIGGDGDE